MRAHLVLLAVATAAAGARARTDIVNTTAGATVRLGAVVPTGTDNRWWLAAAEVAVADINADPNVLPDTTLELVPVDEGSHDGDAVFAVQRLHGTEEVAAIVGPTDADLSSLVGYTASTLGINLVDPFGRQSSISNKTTYPFVSRLSAPQAEEAGHLATLIRLLGWSRVGVFMGSSPNTADFLQAFTAAAADASIEILPPVQFPLDTSQPELYVEQLRATGARVYVFLVPGGHSLTWRGHLARGGLLEPEYTLLGPSVSWFEATDMTPELGRAMAGALIHTGPDTLNPAPEHLEAWGNRLLEHVFGTTDTDATPDNWETQVQYDAVLTAAKALDSLVRLRRFCDPLPDDGAHDNCTAYRGEANEDVTLRRLLRTTPVTEGYAGRPVTLDADTGDRVGTYIVIQLGELDTFPYVSVGLRALFLAGSGDYLPMGEYEWKDARLAPGEMPRDRPLVRYELDEMAPSLAGAMAALAAVGVALCLACAAGTVALRARPIMRMSSWRVNLVSLLGGVMLLTPAFLAVDTALTAPVCNAQLYLTTLGFTLLFAPLFSKVYRVYRIFGSRRIATVVVTDAKLLEIVGALVLLDLAVLGTWSALGGVSVSSTQSEPQPTPVPNLEIVSTERQCASPHTTPFVSVILSVKAALLVAGSYLAFHCRNVTIKALNDSKWIGLAVYSTTMIALLTVPTMFLVGDSPDAAAMLVTASSFLVVSSTTLLVFAPKFHAVWRGTEDEWTQNGAAKGTAATAAHNTTVGSGKPTAAAAAHLAKSPRIVTTASGASGASGAGSPRSTGLEMTRAAAAAGPSSAPCSPRPAGEV